MLSSNLLTHSYFALSISLTSSQNFHQCPHAYDQQQEIPTRPLQRPPWLLIMTKNKQVPILIIFHKLSIWSNNFLSKGFAPTTCSCAFNAFTQCKPPRISCSNNSFYNSWSNSLCDSWTSSFSKVCNRHKKYPIVKLRSLGYNSFEYWTNISSPCAWAIIIMNMIGNWPSPTTFFFSLVTLVKLSLYDPSSCEWYTKILPLIEWTLLFDYGKDVYIILDDCYAFSISIHAPWH